MSKKISDSFGFYSVLTGPLRGYDYLTSLLVDNGAAFVQLRMKDVPREEIINTALRMRKITAGSKTRLIINDDPQIAVEVGADGVHVGQGDMPYHQVRSIVGNDMIVGVSTHNPRQTKDACLHQPDYIGIGPVWATPTKKVADPAIGIDGMLEMLSASTVPAVCIGGIDLTNLPLVLEAGAKNFCMVRQLTQSENPARVLKEITRICLDHGLGNQPRQ
ncbi:MAG: thiamine phosphate synthase [Chitinispirillia bacterium]|nr:thiamine phosphate synthase [Chitinispirillia bacterium]MCL2269645.1 thiamine phosphate synthase [Chitinispirillia bacterium]